MLSVTSIFSIPASPLVIKSFNTGHVEAKKLAMPIARIELENMVSTGC